MIALVVRILYLSPDNMPLRNDITVVQPVFWHRANIAAECRLWF